MSAHLKPATSAIGDLHVSMTNALTRAAHSLTLAEKRIIVACIAQCDSRAQVPPDWQEGYWLVRLHASDFAATYGIDITTAYHQLKDAAKSIYERDVVMYEPYKRGQKVTHFRWVTKVAYVDQEGWIEVEWYRDVVPHLFGLRKEFVSYRLRDAAALKSIYTFRMYECLKSWATRGEWAPPIDEFNHALEVPDGYRRDFKKTRENVIEPALAELQEKLGLVVTWEPRTKGRKVIALIFRFKRRPPTTAQLALDLN